MKFSLPALLLLTAALPVLATDEHSNIQYTPINRAVAGHPGSHVLNDETQLKELRRALKQAAAPSGNGMDYHNGPVMTNTVTIYYIWYGNWNGNTGVTLLESFARNLGGSPYYNINTTYTDGTGSAVKNNLIFGGSTVDNYSLGKNLTDGNIWTVVTTAISSGKFPADTNAVYFVLTSADVNATSGFCTQYCGWHTYNTLNSVPIKYSFVGDSGRCPSGCSAQPSNSPNGNVGADGMASVIAHELSETVSDPQLNAWWDSATGNENGDKCAWTFGVTQAAANGSRYNVAFGPNNFLIQQMWINSGGGGCTMQYAPAALSGITPATGSMGTSVDVTLTGSGFVSGANLAISGAGVTTSNLKVVNATQITATLSVSATADVGPHNVTVTQGFDVSPAVTFKVIPAGFTLTKIDPGTGAAGSTVPLTLTGNNFAAGATVAVAGTGFTVSNAKIVSATQITASLAIATSVVAGPYNVTVTQGGTTSAPASLNVTSTAMTLTGITPATAGAGGAVKVTLVGTNFPSGANVNASGTGVTVSGVTVVSATQMTANLAVAATATTGERTVTVSSGANVSQTQTFTVTPAPGFSSVTPNSATAGTTTKITLAGANFVAGTNVVVSGTGVSVGNVVVVSPTQLTANLIIEKSASAGARTVTLSYGTATSAGVPFTIVAAPVLTQVTPSSAASGTTTKVTLTGANFGAASTVAVDGTGVSLNTVTVVSTTQITANFVVDPLAAAGARNVMVTSGTVTTAPAAFTVTGAAPTLTAISPATAAAGSTVAVTLTGTHFTSSSNVSVAGVTAKSVTVVSPTQITASFTVEPGATVGAHNVTVSSGSLVSAPLAFTVTAAVAPTVTSIAPATGAAGATVAVTLTGTRFAAGNTVAVSGSGVSVSGVTVVSATQITAQLMIGNTAATNARSITVSNGPSASYAVPFTITAAAANPVLTQLDKVSGAAGSTLSVVATGTNFAAGNTLYFTGAGIAVSNVQLVSSTQINATLTITSSASAGARSVVAGTANNPGTSGVTPLTFTVTPANPSTAPTVTGMSPASGMLGTALVATLTGTGFTRDSAVVVADQTIPVLQISYISTTQLSVVLGLGGSVGAHTLAVASGASSTALKSAAVTFNITMPPVPTTSSIAPATGALGSTATVTVQGENFTPDMVAEISGTGVTVGKMVQAGPTFVTFQLIIAPNAAVGVRNVTIKTPAGASNPAVFTVASKALSIRMQD